MVFRCRNRHFFRSKTFRYFLYVLVGYLLGVLLSIALVHTPSKTCTHSSNSLRHNVLYEGQSKVGPRHSKTSPQLSNIYVGMMSAGKFITTRVQRSLDTWLQKGSWKIEVFADADPSLLTVPTGLDFKIVTLPSVDDNAYPPQKKCFMMLRHMCDQHIENYDWFMRVDDDVYLDYPRLSRLLGTINSSLPVFLGTPGFGIDPDDGMENGMYYLMGGPGMIFSRGLMRSLRSHLSYCVRHMFSPHEDIEIGRCVWKNVKNAIIPIAWETIDFFYQQYEKGTGNVVNVVMKELTEKRTAKAVAYHAVKSERLLYQLHKQVLERKIAALLNKTAVFEHEISRMQALENVRQATDLTPKTPLSKLYLILGSDRQLANIDAIGSRGMKYWPDDSPWTAAAPIIPRYLSQVVWTNYDKYYRHQADVLVPFRGHSDREQKALLRHLAKIKENFVSNVCPDFPKDHQFKNGYLKVTRENGFMMTATHRAYGKRGLCYCTVAVQISYGVTLCHESNSTLLSNKEINSFLHPNELSDTCTDEAMPPSVPCSLAPPADRVVLIIPLQGRYRALQQFMERYERDFLRPIQQKSGMFSDLANRKVLLVIVLLGKNENNNDMGLQDAATNLLKNYLQAHSADLLRYHVADNEIGIFSRGAGMQLGSLITQPNDILFFMDIDMIVTPSLIAKCRHIAVQHELAWYPIAYSQYDPDRLCYKGGFARSDDDDEPFFDIGDPGARSYNRIREHIKQTPLELSEERGFWRDFGFGIACLYKSDFVRAGGFDLAIEGWGEEDIRMYLSLLKSGLNVFRAKQSDLVHIHHPKYCDKSLEGEQAASCQRTKASHFASQRCLAKTFFDKHRLSSSLK